MEWTGIENENEFWSAYFMAECLEGALKDTVKAAADLEAQAKEEALKRGGKTWQRAPGRALAQMAREVLDDFAEIDAAKSPRERLELERQTTAKLLDVFNLPHGRDRSEPWYALTEDHLPLPLLGEARTDSAAPEPVLWVFEATKASFAAADAKAEDADASGDPLAVKVDPLQLPAFELKSRAKKELECDDWKRILEKQVFAADHPPRWVLITAPKTWVLIDRTKSNRQAALRFHWDEILRRRDPKVLDACGALLSLESMAGKSARVLLDVIDEEASKQSYGVSESLKKSLRRSIELLGNEAAQQLCEKARLQKKALPRDAAFAADLSIECLRYMYRLLFLFFVESRSELNYAPVNNLAFETGYSLESLRDLEMTPLLTDEDRNGSYFDQSIKKLVGFFAKGTPEYESIIQMKGDGAKKQAVSITDAAGASAFTILPLNGSLFDLSRTPYLNQVTFRNETLQRVICWMSLTEASGSSRGRGRRARGRVSYAHLGINQLGAVYEALLSYRGFFAQEDLYEVHPKGQEPNEFEAGYFVPESELVHYADDEKTYEENEFGEKKLKVYPKESFIYRLTGRDREKSASYYTPEILTKCVVEYALKEYFETVIDKIGCPEGADPKQYEDDPEANKAKAEKILKLRICEPAMGSAAFLNEAINQLSVKYMHYAQKARSERLTQEQYARELQRVKMYMADNCVFGVDLNPVAVELAEVSLWLNALSDDKFVPWFGLQLQHGNSLVGCRRRVLELGKNVQGLRETTTSPYEFRDIGNESWKENQIWQFLLPDPGMANYADADMKKLFPEAFKTLAERRKAFLKPIDSNALDRMLFLSRKVEKLWRKWADELADLREQTTDPYAIYGHNPTEKELKHQLSYEAKGKLVEEVREGDGRSDTGSFTRLRCAMNYWCSLWFWPLDKANEFPTRDDFLNEMDLILSSEVLDTNQKVELSGVLPLFDGFGSVQEDASGRMKVSELVKTAPRLEISEALAKRYGFFHWPLRFADIFMPKEKEVEPGFDLTFGNPPWRVVSWNAGNVVGDHLPYVLFQKKNAAQLQAMLLDAKNDGAFLQSHPELAQALKAEFEEALGTSLFLKASSNYPECEKSQCDLFKRFLPISWNNSASHGVQGFLHPMTSMTETNAAALRQHSYKRLKYIFQFANELSLFSDVHHYTKFGVFIYGETCANTSLHSIMNLYHPRTIAACFEDNSLTPAEGIKDTRVL